MDDLSELKKALEDKTDASVAEVRMIPVAGILDQG